ncbi:hypothetical protein [Fimbriiglobus ruber]|uniref:Uncharacterized protein n=1 Tax=Fimbriiglobus ruber TaxID=1908690 RepID=A0A225DG06_9BACT|nr:hypothetical protein [Fimbriiglobus ruber]OWK36286.1 hypothetical protein FRUB_08849 [Fimbriiglobus ruber]
MSKPASLSFSEFLQNKAKSYEVEAGKNGEIIHEWQDAVAKLFVELRIWLASSDPTGVLQISERKIEVKEPRLGRYEAPCLDIRAFGKWIGIIPKARKTIKLALPPQSGAPERATGRIDITDEVRRCVLYRFSNESGDAWFIEDASSEDPQELTQQNFEEALMSYFQ